MKKIFISFFVFISILTWSDSIIEFTGKVEIRRRGDNFWKSVDKVVDFNRGDSVRTLVLSRASIKLYDGSIIRIEPETVFERISRNSYKINGMGSVKAVDVTKSVRIVYDKNSYIEFEEGEFVLTSNSNLIWAISNRGEFWAKGPSGKVRVLSNYQTIITFDKGPIEPSPNSDDKKKLFQKADLYQEVKEEVKADELYKNMSFFMKIKELKICNRLVEENSKLFINKDDLIREQIEVKGELHHTHARDIKNIMISIDGGENYIECEGVNPFRYYFRPERNKTYVLRIVAKDSSEAISGNTFFNTEVKYISEDDKEQVGRYIQDLVAYIKNEEYSGVMAYFDESDFHGDISKMSDKIIEFFYKYDYFYFDYSVRNFIRFGDSVEMGVDWEYDITDTDTGAREQKKGFTLFKWQKNFENRWRIVDFIDGTLFGIGRR
ncbi:MAG: hypothetical protein M0R46_16130 [Candidatus Muirbacterium halophilum]|nr:hypothetical protein [Candidatus Muirbacterium halophilum]MCK9477445.1 hypothetical protein [Candidatus Muirbacterium halophilum]